MAYLLKKIEYHEEQRICLVLDFTLRVLMIASVRAAIKVVEERKDKKIHLSHN